MKISFTGHRWVTLGSILPHLVSLREQYPDAEWVVGGAIGADSAAARFAIENDIPFHLVLPFPSGIMTKYWSAAQRTFLHKSIDCAASLSVVAPIFSNRAYQLRNERMVDMADLTVAYFTGKRGGTANCVNYAKSVKRTLIIVNPRDSSDSPPFLPAAPQALPGSSKYSEVNGDIFTSGAEVIVNSINCVGVMGKGIALEYKKRYPEMFYEYRKACANKEIVPGQVWVYRAKDRIIFNAAVKQHWRNPAKIEWVEACLHNILATGKELGVSSIALPWMGAMNGWIPVDLIHASTRKILSGVSDIRVTVYEYGLQHSPADAKMESKQ